MEKVYLMNYTFGEGSGIGVYASGLFNQLLKENINVEKIEARLYFQDIIEA